MQKERNQKTFCFINTFKHRRRVSYVWLAQYCHSLRRVIHICGNELKSLCARSISFPQKVSIVKKKMLHMEYTNKEWNTDFSCDNYLHQSRFKTIVSVLRLGGMALNITSLSNIYTLYYTVCYLCFDGYVCS
jgi:hypothetical protein